MKKNLSLFLIAFMLCLNNVEAKENIGGKSKTSPPSTMAGCAPSLSQIDIDINNVRAKILGEGDMWWTVFGGGNPRYEIPKGSGKHSLFASAIWIGGYDASSNLLKVAAQTYRQTGHDFWPGPITTASGTPDADPDVCLDFDRHWKINRSEVHDWLDLYSIDPGSAITNMPQVIKEWPGNGNVSRGYPQFLAPFHDLNTNGIYEPELGEYPYFDFTGNAGCEDRLYGDQSIWWVFNDVGGTHTSTQCIGNIGIEVHAQAFAFVTNDDINNMTFYKYKLINRNSNQTLNQTYFGFWTDPDLGFYLDDYIGCDVMRNLGYCYNGDDNDEGATGYGLNPPAVGIDFFEGPWADLKDGVDNDRDGCVDCTKLKLPDGTFVDIPDDSFYIKPDGDTIYGREKIAMSSFMYYNNDGSDIGNPSTCQHFYNYLTATWKNGDCVKYDQSNICCKFMFPSYPWGGTSDPLWYGTGGIPMPDWSEPQAGSIPADRRFVQSAGPFTLQPGAVNTLTTGAVWARVTRGGRLESVRQLLRADDYAQGLFNSCFKILEGPDAPDLTFDALDKELILSLTNKPSSNNYKESYFESDPYTQLPTIYAFEGYRVYQLADSTVTASELRDPLRAREIVQVDIKNGVSQIINHYYDNGIGLWNFKEEVYGLDQGISHAFSLKNDAFAGSALQNGATYYYMSVAYAYNPDEVTFNPYNNPAGRNQPYLEGKRNVKMYAATPKPTPVVIRTFFGDGPELTRIQGTGNGFIPDYPRPSLDLKEDAEYQKLFSAPYKIMHASYQRTRGPVDVRIYNPEKVQKGNFELWLLDTAQNSHWALKDLTTNTIYTSEVGIDRPYQQLFPDFGFYVNMTQTNDPGLTVGHIESSQAFKNSPNDWLSGFSPGVRPWHTSTGSWANMINGIWAPYKYASRNAADYGPAGNNAASLTLNSIESYSSVDLVITSDRTKWSKCVVIESQDDLAKTIGGAYRNGLRKSASLKLGGNYNLVPDTGTGFSYFPGYAVNVETGERLNIVFGEDSYLSDANFAGETGADMKWNPTDSYLKFDSTGRYMLGGKHVIYIFNSVSNFGVGTSQLTRSTPYDECLIIDSLLRRSTSAASPQSRDVWRNCMWVGYPVLKQGSKLPEMQPGEFLPCYYPVGSNEANDVKIRIRVSKPYKPYDTNSPLIASPLPHYQFSLDSLAIGVDKISFEKNPFIIYPNPSSGVFKVKFDSGENGVYDLKVLDVTGKLLLTKQVKVHSGQNTFDLDLSKFAKGIYFLNIRSGEVMKTAKVLVQ